jgi:hypothetical protein
MGLGIDNDTVCKDANLKLNPEAGEVSFHPLKQQFVAKKFL